MQYKNKDRRLGLSGLMRVKDEAETLAQSIDSCIDVLDELIITYHDCTDGSVQIIENKKLQYPDKILVVPYSYHVLGGYGATDEEYEYAKTLPIGHPQLLATYYNNALQYVNYKYVVKIDADQIYFTQDFMALKNSIVMGVNQSSFARLCGKMVSMFGQRRGNQWIWSKFSPFHWLQYIIVPLFKKQYVDYVVSKLLEGNGYLSLSGVNVLQYNGQWYTSLGLNLVGRTGWPYMGMGDHLIFEADEQTEYVPEDFELDSGKRVLIEGFRFPKEKKLFLLGFYWFHFKLMKARSYNQFVSCFDGQTKGLFPVEQLRNVSFDYLLRYLNTGDSYWYLSKRNYFNFVHNLSRKEIRVENLRSLSYK